MQDGAAAQHRRVDWVDYAKGWCIVLVGMMHATLGVGEGMGQEGWLHQFVAWARPFRMPDFFLIAGLFLYRTIDADWRAYFDRKGLHFAYFYVLRAMIQCVLKSSPFKDGNLSAVAGKPRLRPYQTLWNAVHIPAADFLHCDETSIKMVWQICHAWMPATKHDKRGRDGAFGQLPAKRACSAPFAASMKLANNG